MSIASLVVLEWTCSPPPPPQNRKSALLWLKECEYCQGKCVALWATIYWIYILSFKYPHKYWVYYTSDTTQKCEKVRNSAWFHVYNLVHFTEGLDILCTMLNALYIIYLRYYTEGKRTVRRGVGYTSFESSDHVQRQHSDLSQSLFRAQISDRSEETIQHIWSPTIQEICQASRKCEYMMDTCCEVCLRCWVCMQSSE